MQFAKLGAYSNFGVKVLAAETEGNILIKLVYTDEWGSPFSADLTRQMELSIRSTASPSVLNSDSINWWLKHKCV